MIGERKERTCQFPATHTYGTLKEIKVKYPLNIVFYISMIFQHIGNGCIQIAIFTFGSCHTFIILNLVVTAEFSYESEIILFRIIEY